MVSSEETLLLKMFVEDLKESFEIEKKKQKESQELANVKSEPIRPQPTNFSNINNDFNLNTSQINPLKRPIEQTSFKETPLSPKNAKNVHINHELSNIGVSSSPSSSTNYFKQEIKNEFKMSSFVNSEPTASEINNYVDESSSNYFPTVDELNNEDLFLDFDDDDEPSENSHEQINYCIMKKAQEQQKQISHNGQLSEIAEFLNGSNNHDDLDGLDLNEDDLAVQSILDY